MKKTIAMVLAGGRGSRMGVLCNSKPKPALPFAGKYKVIDFALSNCLNSEIHDVAVMTGYQRSYLANYIKRWQASNAPQKNISAMAPTNGYYLGTADAVYQNLHHLTKKAADTALIIASDHIYKMDYRKMMDFHRAVKADVTVAVVSMPFEQACLFGNVQTNAENKIVGFIEKPSKPLSSLVSMGIYIFNVKPLREELIEDAARPESIHDFGHVIIPKMINQARVFAYNFDDYWQDIGTPEAYYKANMDLLEGQQTFMQDVNWPIFSGDREQPQNTKTINRNIKNSKIGPGCVLKGRVENSILSAGVWVGENAFIKNSVVMANTSVGRNTVVMNSILDEGVTIGDHCQVGIEAMAGSRQVGLTIVGKHCRVPAHSQVRLDGTITCKPLFKPSGLRSWMVEDRAVAV